MCMFRLPPPKKKIAVRNSPELCLSRDNFGSVGRNPKCSSRTARASCNRRESSAYVWMTASGCPCRTSPAIFRPVFSTPFGPQTIDIDYTVLSITIFLEGEHVWLKIDRPDPKQTPIGQIKMSKIPYPVAE